MRTTILTKSFRLQVPFTPERSKDHWIIHRVQAFEAEGKFRPMPIWIEAHESVQELSPHTPVAVRISRKLDPQHPHFSKWYFRVTPIKGEVDEDRLLAFLIINEVRAPLKIKELWNSYATSGLGHIIPMVSFGLNKNWSSLIALETHRGGFYSNKPWIVKGDPLKLRIMIA